ncbi:hypothetical protein KP509_34G025700 [Ceratopteris richardii]|uniref:AD domain-containing protein n=1 Tax=Ceratopteris richardii TaxID=49495 RepID=A0A8T2QIU3_CERRI|nr:hypothetical protein KP509_34G025700 [Ceratopteris richardii]
MAVEPPASNAMEFAAGYKLRIKTTLGECLEGQVLTYDKPSELLVLQDIDQTGPRRNLRFLKVNYIKETQYLGQSNDPLNLEDFILDTESLALREEAAVRQATANAERIGIGVTAEAQDIFDALSKTLPVRWDEKTIVVMNDVRVSSPYYPENVAGGPPAANERVKKVLEFERKRMSTRGVA